MSTGSKQQQQDGGSRASDEDYPRTAVKVGTYIHPHTLCFRPSN